VACLCLCACSGAYLESPPPAASVAPATTVNVSGSFCTDDPSTLLAPVKIAFVLDYSQSMVVSDPTTSRAQAVLDVIARLGQSDALSIAVLLFRGDVNVITKVQQPDGTQLDGFTPSTQLDTTALGVALHVGLPAPETVDQQTTDFIGALSRVRGLIEDDVLKTQSDPDLLARSRYLVIFLSDGIPSKNYPPGCQPGGLGGNACPVCLPSIQQAVLQIARLTDTGAGDVRVNTAYVFNNTEVPPPPAAVHRTAAGLLDCMAVAGNGDFRDFSLGEPIDFLGFDYQALQRLFLLKNLLVVNMNARPGTFAPDSDGDGLSDAEELALGTNPLDPVTNHDGYGDLLKSKFPANFHLNHFDPGCPPSEQGDLDGDGLRDCEEIFIGTSSHRIDSDKDGVPDGIEWLMGTRPSVDDMLDDPDRDGLTNLEELRAHTDPNVADVSNLADVAQRYSIQSQGAPVAGRSCYDFRVENVHLAPTLALSPDAGPGVNNIVVSAAQVPFDAPDGEPLYRFAKLKATLVGQVREPADGELHVPAEMFQLPQSVPAPVLADGGAISAEASDGGTP
jgi:Bacterial TSP3 repeat